MSGSTKVVKLVDFLSFVQITVLHLGGVESSRPRVMTGRASGTRLASRLVVLSDRSVGTTGRWRSASRGSLSEGERRRRRRIARGGLRMASEAKRKSKGAVKVRKRNERKCSDAPKRSGGNSKGWEGGIGKGFGAERCKGARPKMQSVQSGSQWEDCN